MAKLKSGTRIYGTATIDTSVVVGSGVTINASGINASGIITATTFVGALTGTATSTTNIPNLTGDITSANSVTSIAAGVIVDADINASAGIVDTKLATISTALKVSNSATTATNANTVSAIVARDASGNFSAGTITASLTGTASTTTNIPNLTGAITSNNTTTSLGSFTSAQLATALTDETGSGANVFATSPTLVTPALGAASATSLAISGNNALSFNSSSFNISHSGGNANVFNGAGDLIFGADGNGSIRLERVGVATLARFTHGSSAELYFNGSKKLETNDFGITITSALNVGTGGTVITTTAAGSVGIGTTNPSQTLHVQGSSRVTGARYDSTNSPGTSGQVLQSTVSGTQWTTAAAGGGGSGKFDTTIDNVLYVQPTGTLDIVGVGTATTQITTLPGGSTKYLIHSLHVTNISNGDAEITAGFVMNARKVPASISVSVGSSGGPGIHTFTVGSASSITVGMAVTGTGNIGETTGIGSTAGFQFNTYVTSVDGNNITLSKPMSGRATNTLYFSPVSKISSRLPVPVGSAVELLKQPMILNALDSIVLQSTGAGSGIGSTSTAAITQAANSNFLTVTAGAAITNFLASGMLIQPTGNNTGIQTNTFVGVGYTPGALSIPITRPATVALASTSLSFTEVVVPQDGALQVTVVYQSSTDTSYQNGTGTVSASSTITSVTAGISSIPVVYYGTGNVYPSVIQSIRVSNISDGIIYPGGDYPVSVGIGNSDTIFSWLAYNMVIPKNSSIELCEAPKRLGIGQSIFATTNTPYAIEIQIAGKQKTT